MSDGEDTAAGADDAVADDALLVLTAMMLTAARFPSVLGDDYVAAWRAGGRLRGSVRHARARTV
ncbi:hypothetical protein [Streptomyces sp. VB1]|uniref:hypothetical protein n=1 Tax=unclassified Streptomyces TaxID=2593676 RepID=UPI003A100BAD